MDELNELDVLDESNKLDKIMISISDTHNKCIKGLNELYEQKNQLDEANTEIKEANQYQKNIGIVLDKFKNFFFQKKTKPIHFEKKNVLVIFL